MIIRLLTVAIFCLGIAGCSNSSQLLGNESLDSPLKVIADYAEHFEPEIRKDEESDPIPPFEFSDIPNQATLNALKALEKAKSRSHEKYIVLVMLRHYRAQIEIGHQSYELRPVNELNQPSNPILKEFFRLVGINPDGREFISSGIAYSWACNHPELLSYQPIAAEIGRIERASGIKNCRGNDQKTS